MVAAIGVWSTASRWPDLIVAVFMAGIFVTSSMQILRRSVAELHSPEAAAGRA